MVGEVGLIGLVGEVGEVGEVENELTRFVMDVAGIQRRFGG